MAYRNGLPGRDHAHAGQVLTFAVGPAQMPSVDAVRRVLADLAMIDPGNRFLRRFDVARGRLLVVPPVARERFITRLVGPLDDRAEVLGDPARDSGPIMAMLADLSEKGLGDLPFRLSVGRHYCVFEFPHALGDKWTFNLLWGVLLRCAVEGRQPVELVDTSGSLLVPKALVATYARHPALLAGLARRLRGPLTERAAGSREQEPVSDVTDLAIGPIDHVAARSKPGYMDTLREWRAAHAPSATANSVMIAASTAALIRCGLPGPAHSIGVAFDNRRYLPAGTAVLGNFVADLDLTPSDPLSPAAVAAELKAAIEVGQPLAMMTLSAAKNQLAPRRPGGEGPSRAPVLPRFTVWGDMPDIEALPWLAPPEDRFYGTASSGPQPGGIYFVYVLLAGALHVCVSFDASRFDRERVTQALRMLCAEPAALLTGPPPRLAGQRAGGASAA